MRTFPHLAFMTAVALTACAGDGPTDVETDTPAPMCSDGTTPRAFTAETSGFEFGDTAGDFTVKQIDGPDWNLAENWTGCDTYIFIVDFENSRTASELMASDPAELFVNAPDNVHYFFATDRLGGAEDALSSMITGVNNAVEAMDSDEAASWEGRIHFVWNRARNIEGSVGDMISDYQSYAANPANRVDLGDRGQAPPPPLAVFGIDRAQSWDPGGSMSQAVGQPASLRMPSYLPHFYNYKEQLDQRVAATEATEVMLVDEDSTDRSIESTVSLPDASTMGAFDTMELDIQVTCPYRNPFACSEWDRIAYVFYCEDAECTEKWQVAKWITQYWRRGSRRWVIDATPFLPLIKEGGEQHFQVVTGPDWERATERNVRVALRLRTEGDKPKPVAIEKLFGGGNFNAEYNDREPISVTPAAGATQVDLVYILSGHGQNAGNNCAEWCDHRHTFSVGGTALETIRSEMIAGVRDGCALRANEGVPPGQWGNWPQSRAYWCPGLPVPAERIDITANVTPGSPVEVDYSGSFGTSNPAGGNISMQSYMVSYE